MQVVNLYEFARLIPVALKQGPVELCVSRVPRSSDGKGHGRLLLLHGNPANMADYRRMAALLRDDFEVVAIDLPGFGRSAAVRALTYESLLDAHARHVVAALDALDPLDSQAPAEEFFVLGHSHGGAVAQTIAALYPKRVKGLMLLSSVGTPAHWGYRQLVAPGVLQALQVLAKTLRVTIPRPLRWRIVQAIMTPIFSPHPLSHAWVDEQLAVVEERPSILVNMALVATGDPCAQLARTASLIRAPTLFIHGDADRLVPSRHARAIYEIVARGNRSEFRELAHAGHMLQVSHPEAICEFIAEWMQRLDLTAVREDEGSAA